MFKQLHAICKRGPLELMLVGEGDNLRVTVAQKKTNAGGTLNIVVTATPEELDQDLVGAIADAANTKATTKPVKDQIAEQAANAATDSKAHPHKRSTAAKKKTKPAKLAKASKPATKPATKVRLPGATRKPVKPAKAPAASPKVQHHDSRPDKPACIADYRAMKALLGDKLNRETFIKRGKTGRRFERLWDMSWTKFVAAAEGKVPVKRRPGKVIHTRGDETLEPIRDTRTLPLPLEQPAAAAVTKVPDKWPFTTPPKDAELGEDKNDTKHGRDVYDADTGAYLSSITTRAKYGDRIALTNCGRPLTVVRVDGKRVMVRETSVPSGEQSGINAPPIEEHAGGRIYNQLPDPATQQPGSKPEDSAPPSEPSGAAAAADPSEQLDTSQPHPPRVVKEIGTGHMLAGGVELHVKRGEVHKFGQYEWRVTDFNERYIIVQHPDQQQVPA